MKNTRTTFLIDMHTDKQEFIDKFHSLCEGYTIDIYNEINFGVSLEKAEQNISCIRKLDMHIVGIIAFDNITAMQYGVFVSWIRNNALSLKGMAYTDSAINDTYTFEGGI